MRAQQALGQARPQSREKRCNLCKVLINENNRQPQDRGSLLAGILENQNAGILALLSSRVREELPNGAENTYSWSRQLL